MKMPRLEGDVFADGTHEPVSEIVCLVDGLIIATNGQVVRLGAVCIAVTCFLPVPVDGCQLRVIVKLRDVTKSR
jgi:hypothetical protein